MPSAAGGSIQDRLTRKLGPLPVWAWAAIVVGAAIAYSHFHAKTAAASTGPADTGQGAMAANPIDTGAGVGGSAGAGGPMDNLSPDALAALYSSLGGFVGTTGTGGADATTAAASSTSALSTTDTAQASGGGTSSGAFLAPIPVAGTSTGTGGTEISTVTGGVSDGGVITGGSPPVIPGAGFPAPQSKIGQTLTAAGVGGAPGSAGFVTPITPPAISQVFSYTPSSNLLPKAPPVASSTSAVHKNVAV